MIKKFALCENCQTTSKDFNNSSDLKSGGTHESNILRGILLTIANVEYLRSATLSKIRIRRI